MTILSNTRQLPRLLQPTTATYSNTPIASQVSSRSHPLQRLNVTLIFFHMLLLLLNFVNSSQGDWLVDCGDCNCKWNSGKKTADCKNLSLASIPENLSSEVQVLDLSFNRIPYIEQNAFQTAQLQNLHKLFIRNSSLQQIDLLSFTQLEILIELDLSNNLLRSLQSNLFSPLLKVRALVLNGNLLASLGDGVFQNLKYLHKIELKDNHLMHIGTQVFINVPLLSQIYLDGNRLTFLRKETFESLKRITALSLDQNPWNCTCELQIFRDFVLKRNLYTPPTSCYYPKPLRGMLWVEEQPEAFACKPKIIYPARGASINTSKENVTLICRVHASPNTLIAWDYNKQMYRANTASNVGGQQQRVHIQLLRDEQSDEKEFGRDIYISRLTILGAEKSDEGIYTCYAENSGGKDSVQMNLMVQKPNPRDIFLQGNLMIVISLMALGLLSVSVFLAMITCCIYKRFKIINTGLHRHHHHLHHLDVADQLAAAVDQTRSTLPGGTDIRLDNNTEEQKTNTNGGNGMRDKYMALTKQGATMMDNGICVSNSTTGIEIHQLLLSDSHLGPAENSCLERNKEDTLLTKNAHRPAASETNRLRIGNNNGNGKEGSKPHCESIEKVDLSGRGGEYRPDLLPAYKTMFNSRETCYSPIKSMSALNHTEEQNKQTVSHVTINKYNSRVQEYLQSKCSANLRLKDAEKPIKLESFPVALTTSASLTAAGHSSALKLSQDCDYATLKRHSKSLALPFTNTGPSTESSYKYIQPPPPPYNASHRTSNDPLLQHTSVSGNNKNFRSKSERHQNAKAKEDANGPVSAVTASQQAIIAASPSLNLFTTSEYTTRRKML